MAVSIDAEGRDHGHDAGGDELLKELHVDPFDPAGEEVIDALENAQGMGDHRRAAGAAQVGGDQTLEEFVGEAVGRGERQLQGLGIRHSRPFEVGGLGIGLLRERLNLGGRPVDQNDAHVQGPEDGHVHQEVGEVLVLDDRPVDGDDEDLLPELGDVPEDAAEVGGAHGVGSRSQRAPDYTPPGRGGVTRRRSRPDEPSPRPALPRPGNGRLLTP